MAIIKNIIFDLGNVLLDLDYPRVRASFQALFGADWDFARGAADAGPLFDLYQRGRISEVEFFSALQKTSSGSVTQEQLKEAWNSMLSFLPPKRLDLLGRLRKNYRLFLLSNTNYTHIQQFEALLKEQNGISRRDFESYFYKVYYSFEIGLRKPEQEVYRFVLKDAKIHPANTLFIDDLEANIAGAEKAGMLVYHHHPKEEIARTLPAFLSASV